MLTETYFIAGTAVAAVSVVAATSTTTTNRHAGAKAHVMVTARRSVDTVVHLASVFSLAVASMR